MMPDERAHIAAARKVLLPFLNGVPRNFRRAKKESAFLWGIEAL